MIILGIDTSCDDTSVALIEIRNSKFEIRSNIVSSQVKTHAKYGGVYPFLAKREHQRNLPLVFRKALKEAGFEIPNPKSQIPKIDLIAVTVGPGLEPCLWVGVNFAKDLAKKLKLSIIPINHIEAHIMANWLPIGQTQNSKLKTQNLFPAICLVVSGGHTQLILMKNFGNYKILGETRDDAAGECFDKVARILGLGYPGGPAIEKKSKVKSQKSKVKISLPRPMIYQKNYDFSFSGLKTAVLYDFKNRPPSFHLWKRGGRREQTSLRPSKVRKSKIYIQEMAKEVQQAIIDVLIYKTIIAAKNFKAKSIILGGGVSSNKELRKQFKEKIQKELPNIQYLIPNIQFCTDNAAMVAVAGYFHWLKGKKYNLEKIKANANLRLG
jgi:N6-L-threonylcarbamoyladenine synthase